MDALEFLFVIYVVVFSLESVSLCSLSIRWTVALAESLGLFSLVYVNLMIEVWRPHVSVGRSTCVGVGFWVSGSGTARLSLPIDVHFGLMDFGNFVARHDLHRSEHIRAGLREPPHDDDRLPELSMQGSQVTGSACEVPPHLSSPLRGGGCSESCLVKSRSPACFE